MMNTTLQMAVQLGAFGAGAFAWTFAEYTMHRFGMHELRGRGMASKEHLTHHANRDSILEKWPLSWAGVLTVGLVGFGFLGSLVVGWQFSAPLAAGWVAGYGVYDWLHWRAHRRAPRGRYERWLRRHHFHHHFGHPLENHGVTTPWWDRVFGTYAEPGVIKVPRRLAMVWLVAEDGTVRSEYAGDYAVAGGRRLDAEQLRRDTARAFANQAPEL